MHKMSIGTFGMTDVGHTLKVVALQFLQSLASLLETLRDLQVLDLSMVPL